MNGDIDKSTNRDTASKNVVNHGKPNNEQFQAVYNYFLHPQPQCGFWLAKLWILPKNQKGREGILPGKGLATGNSEKPWA